MECSHTEVVDDTELEERQVGHKEKPPYRERLEMGQQKMHTVYKDQYKVLHLE